MYAVTVFASDDPRENHFGVYWNFLSDKSFVLSSEHLKVENRVQPDVSGSNLRKYNIMFISGDYICNKTLPWVPTSTLDISNQLRKLLMLISMRMVPIYQSLFTNHINVRISK